MTKEMRAAIREMARRFKGDPCEFSVIATADRYGVDREELLEEWIRYCSRAQSRRRA